MKTETRTYAWYATHYISEIGDRATLEDLDAPATNFPNRRAYLNAVTSLGLQDVVPTPENIVPVLTELNSWWVKVQKNWSEYEKGGEKLISLRMVVHEILKDPTIDPELVRTVFKEFPSMVIACAKSVQCPEDLLEDLISMSGAKNDPTRETKGGELICFILQNKKLSSHLVERCAKRAKKISTLEDAIYHPNVSRDTLVRIFHDTNVKSEKLKSSILHLLVKKGWLVVE